MFPVSWVFDGPQETLVIMPLGLLIHVKKMTKKPFHWFGGHLINNESVVDANAKIDKQGGIGLIHDIMQMKNYLSIIIGVLLLQMQ